MHMYAYKALLFDHDRSTKPQEGMELTQFGLRKLQKCEGMKTRQHAKYMRDGDVYFTDSHLIWCHYARATLIFEKKGEGGTERQRLSYATKAPWGVWDFLAFQSDAATRPRVWPWLPNAAAPTRPQFKTRGWDAHSSLTRFSQFSAWLWWETYESTLCAFSKRLVRGWIPLTDGFVSSEDCCPRLPQMEDAGGKMATVFEQRALTDSQTLDLNCHSVRQSRKTSSWSNTRVGAILTHGISCLYILFWVHTCCVTVFTCCHPNARHFEKEDVKRERENRTLRGMKRERERVKTRAIKMIT